MSNSIDAYIKTYSPEIQTLLESIRTAIKETVPSATESISYGMPTFKLKGRSLVYFAAYKKHIGFYPTPSGINAFKDEIKGYKNSKGAVQFPIDKPIPITLIKKIVKFRANEF